MQVVCRDKNRLAIAGRHRRGLHVRRREHLRPHRRRRHRRRRARGASGLRPRRPAADPAWPRASATGTTCPVARIDPAPHLFVGAVENPTAPPLDYRVERAAKKSRGRRAVPPAADRLPPRAARGVHGRLRRGRGHRAHGAPAHDLPDEAARALRFMNEHVPGHRRPRRDHRAGRGGSRPQGGGVPARARAGRSTRCPCPAWRGIHITDFRHDDSVARIVDDLGLRTALTTPNEEQHAHGSQFAG